MSAPCFPLRKTPILPSSPQGSSNPFTPFGPGRPAPTMAVLEVNQLVLGGAGPALEVSYLPFLSRDGLAQPAVAVAHRQPCRSAPRYQMRADGGGRTGNFPVKVMSARQRSIQGRGCTIFFNCCCQRPG